MSSLNFVLPATFHARPCPTLSKTTFVARPTLRQSAACRAATLRMGAGEKREDGYVIRESEYKDPEEKSDYDDSGDGFMGEAEMDDMLGVAMPDDLASFERREIQNCRTRDELVEKLREIKVRRRDILVDRRRGLGMDTAANYLDNL